MRHLQKKCFFCFKQQSIPSVFMGQPFPPPESTQIAAVRRVDPIIILTKLSKIVDHDKSYSFETDFG